MSPCLQNGWLASACCIASPFFREVFLSRSPLTCCGVELTLETLNIHVRACPAISGGGMEFPREGFCCRAENRILVSLSHGASCGRRSAYASFLGNGFGSGGEKGLVRYWSQRRAIMDSELDKETSVTTEVHSKGSLRGGVFTSWASVRLFFP